MSARFDCLFCLVLGAALLRYSRSIRDTWADYAQQSRFQPGFIKRLQASSVALWIYRSLGILFLICAALEAARIVNPNFSLRTP